MAVKCFTAVTLALCYRGQAEGFATLTKSGALPPLHVCVSSEQSNVVARKARQEESVLSGFLPVFPSSGGTVTGGARGKASREVLTGSTSLI